MVGEFGGTQKNPNGLQHHVRVSHSRHALSPSSPFRVWVRDVPSDSCSRVAVSVHVGSVDLCCGVCVAFFFTWRGRCVCVTVSRRDFARSPSPRDSDTHLPVRQTISPRATRPGVLETPSTWTPARAGTGLKKLRQDQEHVALQKRMRMTPLNVSGHPS